MLPGFLAEKDLGYQQITVLNVATALTIPAGATMAMVIPETQAVRWRADGINPTAAVGMPLAVGQVLQLTPASLAQAKFIEQTASAKINIYYFG